MKRSKKFKFAVMLVMGLSTFRNNAAALDLDLVSEYSEFCNPTTLKRLYDSPETPETGRSTKMDAHMVVDTHRHTAYIVDSSKDVSGYYQSSSDGLKVKKFMWVSLGQKHSLVGKGAKASEGDKLTPVGVYRIDYMKDSQFGKAAHLSYPLDYNGYKQRGKTGTQLLIHGWGFPQTRDRAKSRMYRKNYIASSQAALEAMGLASEFELKEDSEVFSSVSKVESRNAIHFANEARQFVGPAKIMTNWTYGCIGIGDFESSKDSDAPFFEFARILERQNLVDKMPIVICRADAAKPIPED